MSFICELFIKISFVYEFCIWVLYLSFVFEFCIWVLIYGFDIWVLYMGFIYHINTMHRLAHAHARALTHTHTHTNSTVATISCRAEIWMLYKHNTFLNSVGLCRRAANAGAATAARQAHLSRQRLGTCLCACVSFCEHLHCVHAVTVLYVHTCIHKCMRACTHARIRAYIPTRTPTYT